MMILFILLSVFLNVHANQDICGNSWLQIPQSGILNLTTPYYPDLYPNSADCTLIAQASAHGTITVSFSTFDLETNYDFLEIGRGSNRTDETKVLRLTGQATPTTVSVNGEALWMRFKSDRGVAQTGFFLQVVWTTYPVSCIEDEFACANGYGCLQTTLKCDHIPQCLDKSDEAECNFCGQLEYTVSPSSSVTLSSPNYPNIYWNDLNCIWYVSAPQNGTILMTLVDFDTEEHYDYMTVWEGYNITDDNIVLHLSGQSAPNTLSVDSTDMWVQFTSDKGYGTRGFQLELEWSLTEDECSADEFLCYNGYGCLEEKLVCDSVKVCYDESDEFGCQICGPKQYNFSLSTVVNLTSPFYPETYPENWECVWFLIPKNDGFIVLQLLDMVTEKEKNDPLVIGYGDNATDSSTELLELFGELEPSTMWFRSKSLWLRFQTNHRVGKRGFLIQMELHENFDCSSHNFQCQSGIVCISSNLICDGYAQCIDGTDEAQCEFCGQDNIILSANHSTVFNLTSPLWPRRYPNFISCDWTATAMGNGTTILRFMSFDTKINQHYFSVGYGTTVSAETLVYRLSGSHMPKTVSVDGNEMWLTFSSDHENPQAGFLIELEWTPYDASCEIDDYVCPSSKGQICLRGSDQCDGVHLCPGLEDEQDCDYCGAEQIALRPNSVGVINFTSPFYPNQYPSVACIWYITSAGNGTIVLRFMDFNLETRYDNLYLGHGDPDAEENQILTLTGDMAPRTFRVRADIMWVRFTSEVGLLKTRGFYAVLETEEIGLTCETGDFPCKFSTGLVCLHSYQECDGVPLCPKSKDEGDCRKCGQRYITLQVEELGEYNLQTINYPSHYRNDLLCTWFVTASPHRVILVDIWDFELERGYDHVIIGNGDDVMDRSSHITELTGVIKVKSLVSEQSKLWIQFSTDRTGTLRGFDMMLTEIDMIDSNETFCTAADIDCGNGLCVYENAACDGFNDCVNLEDERGCTNITCPGFYLCDKSSDLSQSQMCVSFDIVCDGIKDCPVGDDEVDCDTKRCPKDCRCEYRESNLHVECKEGWTKDTMQSLPRISHALELSQGNIVTVESGTFKEIPGLRTLSLAQNNISVIRQRAFDGLSNLTWLDLSHNEIAEIGGRVFEELMSLDGLFLWSVPIKQIRRNGFYGLGKLQTLVMVTNEENDEPIVVERGGFNGLTGLQTLYIDDHRLCCHFDDLPECISLEPQPPLFMCGSLMQNIGLRVCMWFLGISAMVGNLFVVIWRWRQKTPKNNTLAVQSYLITNLALADFLMGVYMIILASADAYFGDDYFIHSDQWRTGKTCKFAGFLTLLSSEASVFFLTLISVDRFIKVVFPYKDSLYITPKLASIIAKAIWGVAFIVSLVPVILAGPESDFYDLSDVCIGLPLITRPSSYTIQEGGVGSPLSELDFDLPVAEDSKPAWYFSIIIFLGVNLVCFLVIVCCYIGVFISYKTSAKRIFKSNREEELKVAVRMAIIIGTDLFCWMPVIIMGILSQTGAVVIPLQAYTWIVVLVLPINSSLNPYLYTIHALISDAATEVRRGSQVSFGTSMRPLNSNSQSQS